MADAIATAIYGVLAASTALISELGGTAIWRDIAPRGEDLPYVIYSLASGLEDNVTPLRSQRMVYLVKGVAHTLAKAQDIAADVDAALHGAPLTPDGYINFWTARDSVIEYIETDAAGGQYGHAGAQYVIRFEKV